jgi:2-polyprenyl-3-methyl-5-hydroxy-6-metoxy-1,4-benzoquinol methylase
MIKEQMNKIYSSKDLNNIPWNVETPPGILQDLIRSKILSPCKIIELGCGVGNYLRYLSKIGFNATGVDISEKAIEIARALAQTAGVKCEFIEADVLGNMSEIKSKYDFAYDWELLHHIFPEYRNKYIENVHRLLTSQGRYMSVCFSEASTQFGGVGKYRKTPIGTVLYFSNETEIETLFSRLFSIVELKLVDIQGKQGVHKAIYALMRRKNG